MNGTSIQFSEVARTVVRVGLSVATVYIGGYFLLMRTSIPAIDESGAVAFRSAFLLSPSQRVNSPHTIFAPRACWANYFWLPMDYAWRRIQKLPPPTFDPQSLPKK